MKALRLIGCLWIAVVMGNPAIAEDIPEVFPKEMTVARHKLVLNGYGERERWFMDVYGCALYTPRKTSSTNYIMASSTPTAIRIMVNHDPPADQPERWRQTFREELSKELLSRMDNVYERLDAGDVILFAYAPGHGTKAYRNGRHLFTDPGHGLMQGLLDQWLGPRPVSKNLRRLLLR